MSIHQEILTRLIARMCYARLSRKYWRGRVSLQRHDSAKPVEQRCTFRSFDLFWTKYIHRALGYASVTNMGTWRAFRNYESRHHSYDPTIIEAICASWATLPSFKNFVVGTDVEKGEVTSIISTYPNPASQAVQEASDLFGPDRRVSLFLSLGCGASSRSERGVEDTYARAEITARELERRFGTTGVYHRLSVLPPLEPADRLSQETLGIISAHTSDYLLNPVTDRVVDQAVSASSYASRFTLKSMSKYRKES